MKINTRIMKFQLYPLNRCLLSIDININDSDDITRDINKKLGKLIIINELIVDMMS